MGICLSDNSVESENVKNRKRSSSSVKGLEEREVNSGSDCSLDSSLSDYENEANPAAIEPEKFIRFEENVNNPKVNIYINNIAYKVEEGLSLYDASQSCLDEKYQIPVLCYHPYIPCSRLYRGMCGICQVEEEETGELIRSCRTIVKDGMRVLTSSPKVEENIKKILEEKLESHVLSCPNCPVSNDCSFEKLLQRYEVSFGNLGTEGKKNYLKTQEDLLFNNDGDDHLIKNESLVFDHSKCLNCYRCVRVCEFVTGMSKSSVSTDGGRVLGNRKDGTKVFHDLEDYHENMLQMDCIRCGMCSLLCPVGAIVENSRIEELVHIIRNKKMENLTLVCQVSSSMRTTFPEIYGLSPGSLDERTLVACLKKIGFDYVFDTNFASDLCAFEEAHELIDRLNRGGPFPMFSSTCPAWINMMEQKFPEMIPNVSSCKSPQAMMGAVLKTFWASKMKLDKNSVIVVSLVPCVGKKSEISRDGVKEYVDFALTTRELGRFFKRVGINLSGFKEKMDFDFPLLFGCRSRKSELFGVTGGVTESVISTASNIKNASSSTNLLEGLEGVDDGEEEIDYSAFRGLTKEVKTGHVKIGEHIVRYSIVNGGLNIKKLMRNIKYDEESNIGGKEKSYVECMVCVGGCTIGGGGQPKFIKMERLKKRLQAIYEYSKNMKDMPSSSEKNPKLLELYRDFFKKPDSQMSRLYLHTSYKNRRNLLSEEADIL